MQRSINSNDRILITGKTGSGKTYLAQYLTKSLERLIVIDTKGTLAHWELDLFEDSTRKLDHGENVRCRAIPPIEGNMNEWVNSIFTQAYKARNVTIYIDEMYSIVTPGKDAPQSIIACYTRGRELGIGVWSSTQRPVWIPLFSLSEADHFFMFRLSLEEDRKRMSAFMGPAVMHTIYDPHGFYYASAIDERPMYFKKLKSGKVVVSR